MKITILEKAADEEDEIIIKCAYLDENLTRLINQFKGGKGKMNFYKDGKIVFVEAEEVLYYESVDDTVFAYTKDCVYETKSKLYQLENELPANIFFRANKAVIVESKSHSNVSPKLVLNVFGLVE